MLSDLASDDSELWAAFLRRCEELSEISQAAERELPADDKVAWTGRSVSVPFFAEHMRRVRALLSGY